MTWVGNGKTKNQKNVHTKVIFIKTINYLIHFIQLPPTSGELKDFRVYKYLRELPQQIPNFR
jgi:hypothetical protein